MLTETSSQLRRVNVTPSAALHLGTLAIVFFILRAIRLWVVDTSELLFSTTGPLIGASYTDVHVGLPGLQVTAIAALVAAALVIYGIVRSTPVKYAAIG